MRTILKITVFIFISALVCLSSTYAVTEWKDSFENKKFTKKWWEPFPGGGEIDVGIWKKGWYSVISTGDPNIAYTLLKVKAGRDFIKLHDGLVMEGTYMDSGTGPGRWATLLMLSHVNDKEAYLAGGFIGGWNIWSIHKVSIKDGFGGRAVIVETPMVNSEAGPKTANELFKLIVAVMRKTVTIYIDNLDGKAPKVATSATFAQKLPKGRIGLAAVANHGHWADFTVKSDMLAVEPAGKTAVSWGEIKTLRLLNPLLR